MPDDIYDAPFEEFAQPNSMEELIMKLKANPSGAMQPQQAPPTTEGRAGGSPDALIQFLLSQMENSRAR